MKRLLALCLLLLTGCTGQDFLGSAGFDVSGTYVGKLTRSPLVLAPNDTANFPCTLTMKMTGDSVTGTISTGASPIRDSIIILNNILTGHVARYYEGTAIIEASCYDPAMTYAQATSRSALRTVKFSLASYDGIINGDIEPDTSTVYYYSMLLRAR